MRPEALLKLLKSVREQELYPDEILIIDGSTNDKTKEILEKSTFDRLKYFKVSGNERGLVKQRNFGISNVSKNIDIVCFLDDDIILRQHYFKNLIDTYKVYPEAIGVGGYITNEVRWKKIPSDYTKTDNDFEMDGFVRKMGQRFLLRKYLGLLPKSKPCFKSDFSHGFSVGFLPPSGKIYEAEFFMGGVSSFKREIFEKIKFSSFFEGYGLYEDADFCLRASKLGKMYVNTAAQLEHFHEESGRPNRYNYGKMVIRNGWYVWRMGNPNPSFKARIKWNFTALLLTLVKFSNIFTATKKKAAFTETLGRTVAWWGLLLKKPNP
jgi:GT2 family glycosyltransferase